ncbi:PBSX family phage terminase large subunit [Haloactinospora alba]|uniref:PBSX family phage terminase large subunit n=1 Tax=Haloactinospora alba TaxID=405555 RepID=A0A543N6N4_9ACTN|nr:PBSX family phage terminase large subunit [Haloactinospora alba]TQN27481.1 PBSX family phage terminase large subunit [Haloactinospora alba]
MLNTLPLSRKQLGSIAESTAAVNVWDGAIRSGKTIASLLAWLMFVADAPRGGELLITGRTRETISRNIMGPLQDPALFGSITDHVSYTSGAPTAAILGRRIHVIGASDSKAEKTLRGMTVAGAYCDEVTVLPEEFFTQLLGRMSVDGAKLFGTTNPDSPAHWLKTKFLDKRAELPHWRYWHFTMDDNPALSGEYVQQKRAEFTGLWHRRFIAGEWVAAEGAVYDMWDPATHVIPWASLPRMRRVLTLGLDYGTTNATAALLLALGEDGRLYLVDEWRHDPRAGASRLTDGQLSARLRDWLDQPHLPEQPDMRPEWVVVDPSAASMRLQLHRDGLTSASADNDVLRGISLTATLLAEQRLLVSDRCTGFINEAPGYSWDDEATEKGEDKPLKIADHSLDAARYALATTEALWRAHLTNHDRHHLGAPHDSDPALLRL